MPDRERVLPGERREFKCWELGPAVSLSWECSLGTSHMQERYEIDVFLSPAAGYILKPWRDLLACDGRGGGAAVLGAEQADPSWCGLFSGS